jgi:hypothetical protein
VAVLELLADKQETQMLAVMVVLVQHLQYQARL